MTMGEPHFGYRLVDLLVTKFEPPADPFDLEGEVAIAAQLNWKIEPISQSVIGLLEIDYKFSDRAFLTMHLEVTFELALENWNEVWDPSSQSMDLPRPFLIQLGIVAIGSARGVLYEKTSSHGGIPCILPLLDVGRLVSDQVTIRLS